MYVKSAANAPCRSAAPYNGSGCRQRAMTYAPASVGSSASAWSSAACKAGARHQRVSLAGVTGMRRSLAGPRLRHPPCDDARQRRQRGRRRRAVCGEHGDRYAAAVLTEINGGVEHLRGVADPRDARAQTVAERIDEIVILQKARTGTRH